MTVREFFNMVRQYELDPDAELVAQPLLKDKRRKVTGIVRDPDNGAIVLRCNKVKQQGKR